MVRLLDTNESLQGNKKLIQFPSKRLQHLIINKIIALIVTQNIRYN